MLDTQSQTDPNTPPEARRRWPEHLDELQVARHNEAVLAGQLESAQLKLDEARARVTAYTSRPSGEAPQHERDAVEHWRSEVNRIGVERDRAQAKIGELIAKRQRESAEREREQRVQKRLAAAAQLMNAPSVEPEAQAAVERAQAQVNNAQAAVDAAAQRVSQMRRRLQSQDSVYAEQLRAHRDAVVRGDESPIDAPQKLDWAPYLGRAQSDRTAAEERLRQAIDVLRAAQHAHQEAVAADAVTKMWPHIATILELAPEGSWPIPEVWRSCATVQISASTIQITIPREAPITDG